MGGVQTLLICAVQVGGLAQFLGRLASTKRTVVVFKCIKLCVVKLYVQTSKLVSFQKLENNFL